MVLSNLISINVSAPPAPLNPTITITSSEGFQASTSTANDVITVTASGFAPNSAIIYGYGSTAPIAPTNTVINATSDANGMWNGTFYGPWTAGTYPMIGYDAKGNSAKVTLTVVPAVPLPSINPAITLSSSNSFRASNATMQDTISVVATGFTPNSNIVFGYGQTNPIPSPSMMINTVSNSQGAWSGTFTAPWSAGSYPMVGYDAAGKSKAVNLTVTL